ncbi:MAG: hypothetical protein PUB22_09075 [Clostridiales bacterium]|nr:hypothetical protein [Clostridiales bacterium]
MEGHGEGLSRWKNILAEKSTKWILFVVCGVLLLVISWPDGRGSSQESLETAGISDSEMRMEDYDKQMEQRLVRVLSQIEGAGTVDVMITLRSSTKQILKEDLSVRTSEKDATDQDSNRREEEKEQNVNTFTGEDNDPYVIQEVMPEVEGVVVVADGAGSAQIRQEIMEAVQALFSVETHKIRVLKRES